MGGRDRGGWGGERPSRAVSPVKVTARMASSYASIRSRFGDRRVEPRRREIRVRGSRSRTVVADSRRGGQAIEAVEGELEGGGGRGLLSESQCLVNKKLMTEFWLWTFLGTKYSGRKGPYCQY